MNAAPTPEPPFEPPFEPWTERYRPGHPQPDRYATAARIDTRVADPALAG